MAEMGGAPELEGRRMLVLNRVGEVFQEEFSMTHSFPTITVETVAEVYVLSRGRGRFLSMGQAICALRKLMPACNATDHELEEILAAACVIHSVPVTFDAKTADGAWLH
ncbi:hypothetical protein [Mesorhizobium sp.]|uniref:hypothetical protein n=1 Tax=Mesorhizobium sp. TaxID=1871066 RepID=UPI0026004C9E|nr:hypothetical protein [Mesorhizobium sp.]